MPLRLALVSLVVLISAAAALFAWQAGSPKTDGTAGSADAPDTGSNPAPTGSLAAPKGAVVLTLSGVTKGNTRGHVSKVDFATLDKLAREEVTVYEPFLKRDVSFRAISVPDLLTASGVPASAGLLSMQALDDYHVDLQIDELASTGYIATRADDELMAVKDGGPIRLILTGDDPLAANTDNWIWSLNRIQARD